MPARKEDEIMAEYLLKGGKMLDKTCRTCGCPLFEVRGKTFCVVCAENETVAKEAKGAKGEKKPAAAPEKAASHIHSNGTACTCDEEGMLADELAMTIHALCGRIENEKDPEKVLMLMNAVKAGCEALEILCRL